MFIYTVPSPNLSVVHNVVYMVMPKCLKGTPHGHTRTFTMFVHIIIQIYKKDIHFKYRQLF